MDRIMASEAVDPSSNLGESNSLFASICSRQPSLDLSKNRQIDAENRDGKSSDQNIRRYVFSRR